MADVVICLLENDGDILILRRSKNVGTYSGLWGGVAGFVEKDEEPFETAYKEIKEEIGIDMDGVIFVKDGDVISFTDVYNDKKYDWVVHPFLFHLKDKGEINIDWEHSEYKWILPLDIRNYKTVPRFDDIVRGFFS